MRKPFWVILIVCMLAGCHYGQALVENPQEIVRDPHYAQYQANKDELEHQYLHKKISYAEYLEKKKALDNTYAKEIQDRQNTIEGYE